MGHRIPCARDSPLFECLCPWGLRSGVSVRRCRIMGHLPQSWNVLGMFVLKQPRFAENPGAPARGRARPRYPPPARSSTSRNCTSTTPHCSRGESPPRDQPPPVTFSSLSDANIFAVFRCQVLAVLLVGYGIRVCIPRFGRCFRLAFAAHPSLAAAAVPFIQPQLFFSFFFLRFFFVSRVFCWRS